MRRELTLIAVWSAMVLLLGLPVGVYLMSFRGEGLLGNVGFYLGEFILLPGMLLRAPLGLTMAKAVLVCSPLLYLWFALWLGLARWIYLRRSKATR